MIARDHTKLLVRLHPVGVEDLRPGSTVYGDLEVFGEALDTGWEQAIALADELLPDRADALLSRWEAAYDLHRTTGLTTEQRRERIIARRRYLPDSRPATIDTILDGMAGLDINVVEPAPFRCDDASSVCNGSDLVVLDGALVFFIEFDEVAARALPLDRPAVEYEIGRIKPAHVIGRTRCDDFRCDDFLSIVDLDLLAA